MFTLTPSFIGEGNTRHRKSYLCLPAIDGSQIALPKFKYIYKHSLVQRHISWFRESGKRSRWERWREEWEDGRCSKGSQRNICKESERQRKDGEPELPKHHGVLHVTREPLRTG